MKKLVAFVKNVERDAGALASPLLAALLTVDVDNADAAAASSSSSSSSSPSFSSPSKSSLRLVPDLHTHLQFFEKTVNLRDAARTGTIEPKAGMNAAYDQATQDIAEIKAKLEEELKAERSGQLKGSGVKWFHHKTKLEDMYQLEVDQGWLERHAPPQGMYISKSQTKKVRRFHTKAILRCLKELDGAEQRRADSRVDTMRAVFARFATAGDLWGRAVRCVATVDALTALAAVSNQRLLAARSWSRMATRALRGRRWCWICSRCGTRASCCPWAGASQRRQARQGAGTRASGRRRPRACCC